jgi:hypothetical protein
MLKAIETTYNGYRFRSRLEARWACFYDALGIPYEYEKEGYDLGVFGFYLPDFWLPRFGGWIEIKGQKPTPEEAIKVQELAMQGGHASLIVWGTPGEENAVAFDPETGQGLETAGYPYWCDVAGHQKCGRGRSQHCKLIYSAYDVARAARFEHGEQPVPELLRIRL